MIDKCFEAFFGFIGVLPGAFSMFRWQAIQNDPLEKFFYGMEKDKHSCYEANMYLAEDRVMCLAILIQGLGGYFLGYVPTAVAATDPPTSLIELIKQRRRWINGSTFASIYCFLNFCKIYDAEQPRCRKFFIYLLFIFQII
jgi:chitin synthase